MSILFGHPSGNPNSHHAALAHFETGRLEAFCVPWMPSTTTLNNLSRIARLRPMVQRLARRNSVLLANVPKIQGRVGEWRRLFTRAMGHGDEALAYEANDWLMRTMRRECRRPAVSAVHAYEDCSLLQFQEAKRLGKACIYDMPIGYYPAWHQTQAELVRTHADWLPAGGLPSSRHVRPEQKRQEMELADLVLAPSSFVRRTIEMFAKKQIAVAGYGVDSEFWRLGGSRKDDHPLRFIYAGQCSVRKGTPMLLEAWKLAALDDAELHLIGSWQLAESKKRELPCAARHFDQVPLKVLRDHFQNADVFVFPSFFEGYGLVLLEAMACGLPVIASDATAAADVVDDSNGRIFPTGALEPLIEHLRFFAHHRGVLSAMGRSARARAETRTWGKYRKAVSDACATVG